MVTVRDEVLPDFRGTFARTLVWRFPRGAVPIEPYCHAGISISNRFAYS